MYIVYYKIINMTSGRHQKLIIMNHIESYLIGLEAVKDDQYKSLAYYIRSRHIEMLLFHHCQAINAFLSFFPTCPAVLY